MIELGILLALTSAVGVNVSMLCKHRGAVAAPDVRVSRPLRSAAALFRSRWWTIGFGVAAGAWRCTWWRSPLRPFHSSRR